MLRIQYLDKDRFMRQVAASKGVFTCIWNKARPASLKRILPPPSCSR